MSSKTSRSNQKRSDAFTGTSHKEHTDAILLIGDWFVDEHWVSEIHRSSDSSRTGLSHRRVLHDVTSTVQAFCGAGRSAAFLHQLYAHDDHKPAVHILGLGFWHNADDAALKSLFQPSAPPHNLFRLTPPTLSNPRGLALINMNDALNMDYDQERRDRTEYTTRIIRDYRHDHSGKIVFDRLDWEPEAKGLVHWRPSQLKKLRTLLEEQLSGRIVRAIVLKDVRKGAINKELVHWLISLDFKDASWYVSSKTWKPDWLSALSRVKPELLLVPQAAAVRAILQADKDVDRNRDQPLSRWLTTAGNPSFEALRTIEDLATGSCAKRVVVLPDGFSVIGLDRAGSGDGTCVVQSQRQLSTTTVEMGMASIIFPALIACRQRRGSGSPSLNVIIDLALRITQEWVQGEAERITFPINWNPDPLQWRSNVTFRSVRKAFQCKQESLPGVESLAKAQPWSTERQEWRGAWKEVGVVTCTDSRRQIQLWRSTVEVDGYVCCDPATRNQLRKLTLGLKEFTRNPVHHSSCMLVASPGSGKTFLAQRLALTADLRLLPFNITQMSSKADLLECFNTIVAAQQEERRRLLVFVDEINSDLDGMPVYGSFLTPLEDGSYVHAGKTFNIAPCVWVFAGTALPSTDASPRNDAATRNDAAPRHDALPRHDLHNDKSSDFKSRLSLGTVSLTRELLSGEADILYERQKDAALQLRALENVYLGVAQLKREFPDVRRLSEQVLRAFWILPLNAKVRDIKHFVRRFENIQYGRVSSRNLPNDDWPGDKRGEWKEHVEKEATPDKPDIEVVN